MHIVGSSYIRTLSVLFIYVYCTYLLNYFLCKLRRNSINFKNYLFENLFFRRRISYFSSTVFQFYRISVLPYFGSTVFQFYRISVLPYFSSTVFQFYRISVLPYFSSTAFQFYRIQLACVMSQIFLAIIRSKDNQIVKGEKIQSLENNERKSYILSKLITRKKPLELLQYVVAVPMYYKR